MSGDDQLAEQNECSLCSRTVDQKRDESGRFTEGGGATLTECMRCGSLVCDDCLDESGLCTGCLDHFMEED